MEVEITNAKCLVCGKKVDAKANISGMFVGKGNKKFVFNSIYTYWACEAHGAVWAEIDGQIYPHPSDLFDTITFADWKAEIKREEAEK